MLMPAPPPAPRFRFGVFEADAATGELRKHGIRIRLNAQPFQVLTLLLARPGELLTRDEIARELWPDGTFVDFDHGVNSAVNRIREALGDRAANPRFVETLARRGYRFIAPVERVEAITDPVPPTAAEPLPPAPPEEPSATEDSFNVLAAPHELPRTPHAKVTTLFVLLQLMYVAFYVGALANLIEIHDLLSPLPYATAIFALLIVTAAILIPARAFVLSAALLHPPRAKEKLLRMWPFLLALDLVWSLAPFLLLHHINLGLALACTALLVYSPFAQRSLVLMGAGSAPAMHA